MSSALSFLIFYIIVAKEWKISCVKSFKFSWETLQASSAWICLEVWWFMRFLSSIILHVCFLIRFVTFILIAGSFDIISNFFKWEPLKGCFVKGIGTNFEVWKQSYPSEGSAWLFEGYLCVHICVQTTYIVELPAKWMFMYIYVEKDLKSICVMLALRTSSCIIYLRSNILLGS